MRDFLIAVLVLGGGFGALWLVLSQSGTEKKDERDPDAPRNPDRSRGASEAAAAAPAHQPLSDADAAAVAELHEYFQEIGTSEIPVVHHVRRRHVYRDPSPQQFDRMRQRMLAPVRRFEADPLTAPIPDLHHVAPPVEFVTLADDWFAQPALEAAPMPFPDLPPEPVPDPLLLNSFTGSWNGSARRELRALLDAEAKVEASR